MESIFFSGSENLYKYLVGIGLILMVSTVYYPLKEQQELEIKTIELENQLKIQNYSIEKNQKNLNKLHQLIKKNGKSDKSNKELMEIDVLNDQNYLNQLKSESKYSEIQVRKSYIWIYKIIFWVFFPLGVIVTIFGFFKWKKVKKIDDNILKLQNEKLEIEVYQSREDTKKKTT